MCWCVLLDEFVSVLVHACVGVLLHEFVGVLLHECVDLEGRDNKDECRDVSGEIHIHLLVCCYMIVTVLTRKAVTTKDKGAGICVCWCAVA